DQGVPYLFVNGFGRFEASGAASWQATLITPNAASEVIVRLTVPPVEVGGNFDGQGPALWRSRLRGELLVDGYPAWSTEAVRFDQKVPGSTFDVTYLDSFGRPLRFPSNNVEDESNQARIYLSLGTMPPTQTLALAFTLRADTRTVDDPDLNGKHDNACRFEQLNDNPPEAFCSRGTVTVHGDPADGPLFFTRPAS